MKICPNCDIKYPDQFSECRICHRMLVADIETQPKSKPKYTFPIWLAITLGAILYIVAKRGNMEVSEFVNSIILVIIWAVLAGVVYWVWRKITM